MDLKKMMQLVSKNNIDQVALFQLVDEAKKMDLSNDDNIRALIKKGSKVVGKSIDSETEDKIVEVIKREGIGPGLFKFL